ncbi:MAG: response regulator [Chitinivibrionales bacterium]|nr:response regulator [Chitinivibrionales bacterium]
MNCKNESKEILVVDDCPEMRAVMIDVLKEEGYIVIGAESGDDAMKLLRDLTFKVLVTDVDMPGMNGLELARYVKKEYPDTEILIVTGSHELCVAETVKEVGAEFMQKPFCLSALIETVRMLIGK